MVASLGLKNYIQIKGIWSINPFIAIEQIQILEERLRNRGTETEETLKKRLSRAALELQYGEEPGNFDLVIVNDNFEEAYEKLENFLIKVKMLQYIFANATVLILPEM